MTDLFKKTDFNNETLKRNLFFSSSPNTELMVLVIILAILVYFPIFSFLGTIPMRIWDEARLAINAIEMVDSGNLFVTTYNYEPDLWNTKPPLMIWLQAGSISLFGISEFAVRLPSALAAFLTCMVIFIFSYRISGSNWLPFIITLVLISSPGYVSIHGIRTADYDSLLTLMVTMYTFCIYYFLITGNKKYYYAFFIFLILAIFTKGIAGLLMAPGILIFILLKSHFTVLLKLKETWIGIMFLTLIVATYYFIQTFVNPGYLENMIYNEITGRYLSIVEKHAHPFDFYFSNIIHHRYAFYIPFLISGIIFNSFSRNIALSQLSLYCSIVVITFLLIISYSTSKLEHYDLPVYPLFAVICGIFIYNLFNILYDIDKKGIYFKYNILPVVLLFFIFSSPYFNILNQWVKPKETNHDIYFYSLGYALQKVIKNKHNFPEIKIAHEGDNAHIEFYRHILSKKGTISEYTDFTNLKNNDILVIGEDIQLEQIPEDLYIDIIETVKQAKVVQLKKIKKYIDLTPDFNKFPIDNNCYETCNPWIMENAININSKETVFSVFSDFETGYNCHDFTQHIISERSFSGNRSIYINKSHNFSASFKCISNQLPNFDFIEITGKIWSEKSTSSALGMLTFRDSVQTYLTKDTRLTKNNIIQETSWSDFQIFFNVRKNNIPENSDLIIFFYNNEENSLFIDDIRITFFATE